MERILPISLFLNSVVVAMYSNLMKVDEYVLDVGRISRAITFKYKSTNSSGIFALTIAWHRPTDGILLCAKDKAIHAGPRAC